GRPRPLWNAARDRQYDRVSGLRRFIVHQRCKRRRRRRTVDPVKLLDGVRVLELGALITAPLAGMMLADLGADVIKIENPNGGDSFRPYRGKAYSPRFAAYNRGKRSVTLDLSVDAGRRAVLALVKRSDVLIENFRPDVMARLHLDWDVLHAANPRLIHCSITGFGAD